MKNISFFLFALIWFKAGLLFGGNTSLVKPSINNKPILFIENKGQVADPAGNQIQGIKYYIHQPGMKIYFKAGLISFNFSRIETMDGSGSEATGSRIPIPNSKGVNKFNLSKRPPPGIKIKTADLKLVGANSKCVIISSDQQEYYENFYLGHLPEKGIVKLNAFKTITYKNIYSNIDMIFEINTGGIEYKFMIYPGGNVEDIKMKWEGITPVFDSKKFRINYKINNDFAIHESGLSACQAHKKIKMSYRLKNNAIGFITSNYDKRKPLIIDPELQWSAYYGGSGDEEGRGLATDADNNIYMTGWTASTNLATDGSSFGGNYDAFITKFNSEGKILWATYYGGDDVENSFSIAIDKSGMVYICGSSASANGIATKGAYQEKLAGFTDGFIAKFNRDGVRQWATYFGGPKDDQALGISVDAHANLFVTGFTLSNKGIATPGAYNTQYGGGRDNGFLAAFDSSGSIRWSTYYGGNQNDYSFAVVADVFGYVYITGTCSSATGIATSGAFRTGVGGWYDGFIAKFSNAGALIWGSYFGNGGDDECTAIVADTSGNVYITGNTSSDSGIATSGAHQTTYLGGVKGYDVFLSKISGEGKIVWSTYYGGNEDDFAWGMAIGHDQDISITGYTYSNNGIAIAGAYQSVNAGMGDAYIAKFRPDGNLDMGSYYGGTNMDLGYAVTVNNPGEVYIAGVSSSKTGIANPVTNSDTLWGSSDCFLAKFGNQPSGIKPPILNITSISISPNPVLRDVTVEYNLVEANQVKMEIFDLEGKFCGTLAEDNLQMAGFHSISIHLDSYHLKPGIYYLNIIAGNNFTSRQLLKL